MHTVFVLLCFVVVVHWLIFPYPSGLLHWHCGNLTIAPVPAKQPWWIWINTSCELIMNDCVATTKQSTTKPCAYFLGYTVLHWQWHNSMVSSVQSKDIRSRIRIKQTVAWTQQNKKRLESRAYVLDLDWTVEYNYNWFSIYLLYCCVDIAWRC